MNIERLLVTPNNIEFPSAHYAFYFKNSVKILKDDLIGTFLSSTVFKEVPTTELSCYISYLPNGKLKFIKKNIF